MAQDNEFNLDGVDIPLTRTATKYEEAHDGSSSDSEYQQAIEIVFNSQNPNRRKSSIIPQEAERMARRYEESRKNTACFVHSLLDRRKKNEEVGRRLTDVTEDDRLHKVLDKLPDSPQAERKSRDDVETVHSRLLTKKQLSEMALGIRELSKKLGSLRVRLRVKTIFLLTKAHDEELIGLTRQMTEWLLSKDRETPYIVFVENTLEYNRKFDAEGLKKLDPSIETRLKYWNNDMTRKHPHTFDFVISLGGDGTVLYASWLFQRIVPPVLSFSLGSLGFLTKFDFDNYQETLTKAFSDGVVVSLRLRFEGTIMRANESHTPIDGGQRDLIEELIGEEGGEMRTHKPDQTFHILNDLVVDRGPNATMSTIEVFGDDEHFTTVQADGICVSTPTGSTAYNLAAGGSLCHPENPVMMVTAVCAHTLSFRPIILPDTIVLRVGVPYDARTTSWASFDGRERIELHPGDYVTISASRYPFANVMPPGRRSEDWITSISRTLQWNSRQRQKAFREWEDDDNKTSAKRRKIVGEDSNGQATK